MPRPLRFAIVGLDHWYTAIPLAQELAIHPAAELSVVADARLDRAQEVGGGLGVAAMDDIDAVVERDDVDVVASFISAERNPDVCIRAAAAGKHIVSVKPVARRSADAQRVVDAVDAAGITFLPAECRPRTSPMGRHLARLTSDGGLGRLVSARFSVSGHPPQAWPGATESGWWTDPERTPGGAWIDHAIYDVDRMRHLLGIEPITVTAHMANLVHRDLPVEDFGHAVLAFSDGTVASMEHTWTAAVGAGRISSTFAFQGGTVIIDSIGNTITTSAPRGSEPGWTVGAAPSDTPALDSLLANLRGEEQTLGTVHDALANLIACESAYRAAASGDTVTIPAGA